MDGRQIASTFVTHVTVLLAINLSQEADPALSGLVPDRVPDADALLDDSILVTEAIRTQSGDPRLERALQWFDSVWVEHPERAALDPLVRAELDRQRHRPAILDLDDALTRSAALLETLVAQTACFRDTAALDGVMAALRRWQAAPSAGNLSALDQACAAVREPVDLPSTELIMQIGFFAREGSLDAADYLALHFKPGELLGWDPDELTDLLRTRYPLLRRSDVENLLAEMAPITVARCA